MSEETSQLRRFYGASIQRKQTLVILLTTGAAVVVACAGFVAFELISFRGMMVKTVSTLAGIIATENAVALDSHDQSAALENLSALRGVTSLEKVWIFDARHQVFAEYQQPGQPQRPPPRLTTGDSHRFTRDSLFLQRSISHHDELVGQVGLEMNLDVLHARLWRHALIAGTVLIAALLVAFQLSLLLQRLISRPILELAATARAIARGTKKISDRALKRSDDEIGQLVDDFNAMLVQIGQRDAALLAARDDLERNVTERTAELHREIAERRKAEEALWQSEQLYQQIALNASDVLYICHRAEGRIECFGQIDNVLGYEEGQFPRTVQAWTESIHPEDRQRVKDELEESCRSGQAFHAEYRIARQDGTYLYWSDRGRPIYDYKGTVSKFIGACTNITERKLSEEALRLVSNRLTMAARAANLGVWEWDIVGNKLLWDESMYQIYGQDPEQCSATFQTWEACLHPQDKQRTIGELQQALDGVRDFHTGFRVLWPDGSIHYITANSVVVRDAAGQPVRMLGINADVTARQRAEQELQAARFAAESANQAKSQFLANMSHEIRTPMNGIIGMTELALETKLTAEQRSLLSTVQESAATLLSLINDILDVSKIEAGKLHLDPSDFSLRETLDDSLLSVALRAHQKGLELACHLPPELPDLLIGDSARLRQIIVNLVGNAVKFTTHGEVIVRAKLASADEAGLVMQFTVEDTGIGIPSDKLHLIFESFTQADGSTTRNYGGTGLGLTISRQLVVLMGGRIWVESEPGRGSQFHFTARFLRSDKTRTSTDLFVNLRGLTALVVDDNETSRRVLHDHLARWEMKSTAAANAGEAVAALDSATQAGRPFSVALVDTTLPGTDAFPLALRLRDHPGLGGRVIMLLSSATQLEDAARCRSLGLDLHLTKPVRRPELLDTIMAARGGEPSTRHRVALENEPGLRPTRPLNILLAEDNAVNQRLAVSYLEKWGHTVTVADNGRLAVEAWEQGTYDLILMDVQMPEMSGYEAVVEIRRRESAAGPHDRIPVVAMTAHALEGDREKCISSGMDEYVTKPIERLRLFDAIESFFASAPFQMLPAESAAPSPAPLQFDPVVALGRVDGDRALLKEIVQLFLEDTPSQLADLRHAVVRGDGTALEHAAHALKGAISNFGAKAATDSLLALELMGRAGDLARAETAISALEQQIQLLLPALAALIKDQAA